MNITVQHIHRIPDTSSIEVSPKYIADQLAHDASGTRIDCAIYEAILRFLRDTTGHPHELAPGQALAFAELHKQVRQLIDQRRKQNLHAVEVRFVLHLDPSSLRDRFSEYDPHDRDSTDAFDAFKRRTIMRDVQNQVFLACRQGTGLGFQISDQDMTALIERVGD